MMPAGAPADEDLLELVRGAFDGRTVDAITRHPYPYATSSPLEELQVRFDGGAEASFIFKNLAWDRLLDDARRSKPGFLYEPRRTVETYLHILRPSATGPRCYAAIADARRGRYWLLLEKVPGVELWQVGELEVWENTARWVAEFQSRFVGEIANLRATNPYLLNCDASWFDFWRERAQAALAQTDDFRASELLRRLDRYDDVVDTLAALPRTFVHGEFYPSNVLVARDGDDVRICPVDWEMAGTGAGLLDLAALAGGFRARERGRLFSAYRSAMLERGADLPPREEMRADLDRCRLHLALQWIGWSASWNAPAEHAHDWVGEALVLARRFRL
jgi:aminoglycoside phosphotransferase (APT) family kinase protein